MGAFRWNPEDYARSSSAQETWARELIATLGLRGDERVLDLGCGDGKVSAILAEQVPRGDVVGLDSSPEMIAYAREHLPSDRWPRLRFCEGDARALDFDNEFDVVFSNAALHWVSDHGPVLRGISRALRPGGRALLQMGGKGNAADILGVLDDMLTRNVWSPYFQNFEFRYGFHAPEEYKVWLAETELEARRLALIPRDMKQRAPDGLAAWVRTTWLPYTQRVPEALAERFIAEVVARYVERHPPDADGFVHVRMARLEADLVKKRPRPVSKSLAIARR